jgi:hypothetical protein
MERCRGGELHHGRGIERAVLDVLYDPKLNVPPRTEKSARTRLDTKTTPDAFRGTDGSNPVPSSGESRANRFSEHFALPYLPEHRFSLIV